MEFCNFGIAGAGLIAKFHARAIKAIPGARLIAIASRTESRAKALAAEFAVEAVRGYEALIAREDIDVVTVCTPSGAHTEVAIAAAKAGKNVIVEKPLEITLEKCDRIIEACRKNRVKLGVIFQSRFFDASRIVKNAVEDGRFGRLTMADAYVKWWRSQEYYDKGQWKGTWALDGGGALMNQSIHAVDLLLWLVGPIKKVAAYVKTLAHKGIEVEDTAVAAIEFENGALGVIEGATSAFPGFLKRIEISGDKGTAVLEEEDIVSWMFDVDRPEDEKIRKDFSRKRSGAGGAADPAAIGVEGHTRQFEDFIRAIRENRTPAVSGEEGRKAVELVLAIYRSSQIGKCVELPLRQ